MAANDKQREALTELLEKRGQVDGRFTNLKRLNNGSAGHFSALFSATDAQTNQAVALKFLLPMFSADYRDDSFSREASLLEHLRGQPDIIQLVAPRSDFTENLRTESGIEIPVPFSYYALELANTDLGTLIANDNLNAQELLLAFRVTCRAVQRLHSQSLVHRDIKPPNILVMADGTIRLSDLGTARRIDEVMTSLASYTAPPGDVRYSPPEMIAALHDDTPAVAFHGDFFALGAILFEMFAGTILGSRIYDPPFLSDLAQVMANVKRGQRRLIFDSLIPTIADARPIPSVTAFGARIPNCLRRPIDDMVQRLAALNYQKRLCNFPTIFNRINLCLLILRNEAKYQRWLIERERRRERARGKLLGSSL